MRHDNVFCEYWPYINKPPTPSKIAMSVAGLVRRFRLLGASGEPASSSDSSPTIIEPEPIVKEDIAVKRRILEMNTENMPIGETPDEVFRFFKNMPIGDTLDELFWLFEGIHLHQLLQLHRDNTGLLRAYVNSELHRQVVEVMKVLGFENLPLPEDFTSEQTSTLKESEPYFKPFVETKSTLVDFFGGSEDNGFEYKLWKRFSGDFVEKYVTKQGQQGQQGLISLEDWNVYEFSGKPDEAGQSDPLSALLPKKRSFSPTSSDDEAGE